jgi:hypothetical protein
MAEEARRIVRKSLRDCSLPSVAIAPMFQATGRCVSTLVVSTKRRRPCLCSSATLLRNSGVTKRSMSLVRGQVSTRLDGVEPNSNTSAAVIVV